MNSVPLEVARDVRAAAARLVQRDGHRRFGETARAMESLATGIELGLPDDEIWRRDCAYQKLLFHASVAP